MQTYTVKKLAKLSGVSVRTLHHYDKIGLLKPATRTEARYRLYGEQELLRLQQILFYKELGFSLKKIREVLDDPEFELIRALESHKEALKARQTRIDQLLITIDKTIDHLKNEKIMMKPEELYEGLNPEYRQEAIDKYGKKAIEKSEQELVKLGKAGFEQLKADFEACNAKLFSLKEKDPTSEVVQREIANHYQFIRQFWGTTNTPDPQAEAYAGLGKLYVQDERYTTVDGKPQPEFAQFLSKAMAHFADQSLK